MKLVCATICTMAAAALLVATPTVLAQAGLPAATPAAKAELKGKDDGNTVAEAALAKQIEAEFVDTPLSEVFDYLQDLTGVEFYVNWKKLAEEGVAKDAPITIRLKMVRLDLFLELALGQAGDSGAYVLRDGILIVSSAADLEQATEVRVYNCRDLLRIAGGVESGGGGLGGPSMLPSGGGPPRLDVPGASPGAAVPNGVGPTLPGGLPPGSGLRPGAGPAPGGPMPPGAGLMMAPGGMGGLGGPIHPTPETRGERLIHLLTTTVAPNTWQESGGFGSISEFGGLLVVNHNARTHRQIEKVLGLLRESATKDWAKGPAGR